MDELFYETGMLTNEIAKKLKPWNLKVYGDSADPRLIQEIRNRGVNIYPVDKYPGSVVAGIDKIKEYELFVTKRSYHIMEELRNQKLLEFAGENVRWDDLVRWYSFEELKPLLQDRKTDTKIWELSYGTNENGEQVITGYTFTGRIEDTQNYANFQKKHMYYPIPQSEVDANLNLEQKADWK